MAMTIVQTRYGRMRGAISADQRSAEFRGIPYAKPPVGNLRWRPPEAPEPWTGTLDARSYGSIPWQGRIPAGTFYHEFYPHEFPRSEDCLFLNVTTPAQNPDEKLPVAVWIHGGNFIQGYGHKVECDGASFARQGIVYVSLNYRLNIFGLATDHSLDAESGRSASGNYCLQDQIAALKWVYENIAAFGGDPGRITVFGQSAGAMSCYALMRTPALRGLIRGAIMESGGGPLIGLDTFTTPAELREQCRLFLDDWGYADFAGARAVPADELFAQWWEFRQRHPDLKTPRPIESGILTCEDSQEPTGSAAADVPVIIGITADEDAASGGATHFSACFEAACWTLAEQQARRGRQPAYVYRITNVPPGEPAAGSYHSGEHYYVFHTLERFSRPFDGRDYDLSAAMNRYWGNFIKNGSPNGADLPTWEPHAPASCRAMRLDRECAPHMEEFPPTPEALSLMEGRT